MKKILLSLTFFVVALSSSAQNLVESRVSSYYTFIYKISNAEAEKLYRSKDTPMEPSFFHTLVDQFPTDSTYNETLAAGHYLYVKSIEEKLQIELESVNNLEMVILNNSRDLLLLFRDEQGNEITSLKPRLGVRTIPFNRKLNTFRIPTTNRQGWISALYQGHENFFNIERRYNNTLPARTKRRILGTFPLNHILSPVFYITRSVKSLLQYGYVSPPGIYHRAKRLFDEKTYDGYMVLNKPKYKPGDTVRIKTYIVTKKGKPVTKTLSVQLYGYRPSYVRKKLGEIKPYRPGAYTFEFVLSDSLKLLLDQQYWIDVKDKNYNNYPSQAFWFEQYELKANTFSLMSAPTDLPNRPATLLLKGTDINDLPVYDVSADIIVTSKTVRDFYDSITYVPDTLWVHRIKLDPLGDTKVSLPDSIYPNASLEYEVQASFINAENERHVKTLKLSYDAKAYAITSRLQADSIYFTLKDTPGAFALKALDKDLNILESKAVQLPYAAKIKESVYAYQLWSTTHLIHQMVLANENAGLEVMAQRTKDSLTVFVQNTRNLFFRYQLFKNNTIIEYGSGHHYSLKKKTNAHDRYYFAVQYVWGDSPQEQNYDLPFAKKPLTIAIDHPTTAFPGQTVNIKLNVKDAYGRPVHDADLTAYAITKKFRDVHPPAMPQYERFKSRKGFNSFSHKENEEATVQRLAYAFWKNKLGLDSISYYQFLYPGKDLFLHYSPVDDSITQVAPYVIKDGVIQSAQYIYIGNRLKYVKGTQGIVPYSFASDSGKVSISIRLSNKLLILSDIPVIHGQKLIVSVDEDQLPPNAIVVARTTNYTREEVNRLTPHFLYVNRSPNQSPAYLRQGNRYYLLRPLRPGEVANRELAGPFFPGPVTYSTHFSHDFYFKPERVYTFEPQLIDRESIPSVFKTRYLYNERVSPGFHDQVLNKKRVEDFMRNTEQKKPIRFRAYPDSHVPHLPKGSLTIERHRKTEDLPLAIFILNLDQPDIYYLFPGHQSQLHNLVEGNYQVVMVQPDEHYIKTKPVFIKPFGRTFLDISDEKIHKPDTFSREVIRKVKAWAQQSSYVDHSRQQEMQNIRQLYYREATDYANLSGGNWITGHVSDDTSSPVPGVNVLVKGTTIGTVTDIDGNYRIYAPANAVLIFSFIGYVSQEVSPTNSGSVNVKLDPDIKSLSEVVVIGYGVQRRSNLTGSVQSIQGKIAGISVRGGAAGVADSVSIMIRGASTLNASHNPLVVIDGVIMKWEDVNHNKISAIEVLKPSQATALYGSRGSQGVILISTKPGTTKTQLLQTELPAVPNLTRLDEVTGSTLRKNFRDYAFWKPRLRTGKNGDVNFNVTFPDDITAWNMHVLGMGNRKHTGQVSTVIQSFKPLAAQLALPRFLIQGDSALAIGKVTNYTPDSMVLKLVKTLNEGIPSERQVNIKHSLIDSILLPGNGDSISVTYKIVKDKYEDGELRKIPVLPVGTKESQGIFIAMPGDTTFTLSFDRLKGNVKLYAQTDMLDVLWDEVQGLKAYPYDCNEQLASKLKAFLAEKAITSYKQEKFEHDKDIEKIIKKLAANQSEDGGWSWWGNHESELWISLHVAEALHWAARLNYRVLIDHTLLKNRLMASFSEKTGTLALLRSALYLSATKEVVMVKAITDTLAKQNKLYNNHYKLLAQRLLQLNGIEPDWTWIEGQKNVTLKGNWYWGEEKHSLWNNDVDNTLIVYQLLEHKNPNDPNLFRLRNYFLEKRNRSWRNTYQSSNIIEVLLPGLLKQNVKPTPPALTLSGAMTGTFTKFPIEKEISNLNSLTVTKAGSAPVYFTAYQEAWNSAPEKVEKDFVIHTQWEGQSKNWKAGKPIQLKISLDVKKDAEYVMITVPIPAGCSYESKRPGRMNGEVYREYDLHETRIYCNRLIAGNYTYTVSLIPRYKGKYHVNPAKAEWMYFPVIFGRNEMQKIAIE